MQFRSSKCKIVIDDIYDKIEDFKDVIKYLAITLLKNNNGEETTMKRINRWKAKLERKLELLMQEEFETCKTFSDLYYGKLYI